MGLIIVLPNLVCVTPPLSRDWSCLLLCYSASRGIDNISIVFRGGGEAARLGEAGCSTRLTLGTNLGQLGGFYILVV